MLDKTSFYVLQSLNKLADGTSYKVVTSEDILATLSKNHFDVDSVNQIMDFLDKQEYINIKFSEENTYCYSLLPKARIYLEQQGTSKAKKNTSQVLTYLFVMIASFIGSMLAMLIFFYLAI